MTSLAACIVLLAASDMVVSQPLRFDARDTGDSAPVVEPWAAVAINPDYGGHWVVTGDLDCDGAIEIVSAKNHNEGDIHYTSSVAVHALDGRLLWTWGNPADGRREFHHDVACQIYDWDGDTHPEVVVAAKGAIVELDGRTGAELRRIPIAVDATDCIVFCNVSGNPRAADIIVKDRYDTIYVYNYGGELLWTVRRPGGYRTCHQPRPYDIDGDGKDEIFAGYSMLNHDGTVRWTISSGTVDLSKGHNDGARCAVKGASPDGWRFILTCCGANCMAYIDGNGKTIWEQTGFHYESLNVGRVFADVEGPQFLVDIDHVPKGESPVVVIDDKGSRMSRLTSNYSRHHKLLDWTGDGLDEILIANACGVFDNTGRRIATLATDSPGIALQIGDMTGDNIVDVAITTSAGLYVFENKNGRKSNMPLKPGCEINYTFY
jgi:hypothetical protein